MKISLINGAYALTSDIKAEDIEFLEKNNPEALKLTDKEGNEIFAVSYKEGKSSVSPFGVTFGSKSLNDSGKAVVTGNIPQSVTADKAKEYVAEIVAPVVENLETLEKSISEAANKARAARAKLISNITVA